MSWPGTLWESVWRNSLDDVENYLNLKHHGHYWVLNLCSEGAYRGNITKIFEGRNTRYWIDDHNPCSLAQIQTIIYQSDKWMAQDPSNVMVIHCKGGKGRTGMIIACLLLEQGIKDSPEDALSLFARMRTSRGDADSAAESAKKDSIKIQRVSCLDSALL
ncbi:uncharacterized protein [Blastocystis hominis]|uniref:Uncharacterized protein n=1 Tax=Blastocystis hominis TaxID=12968 RepID=D8LZ03_BLAHO|nr:uncharacterized protein [Blastocystis hominis]CBK21042.2 unnamed protein product [Blastocystis hominis]|eukprot:XP_012895090.1 uncharacterized protein [Blastocystis hominis]